MRRWLVVGGGLIVGLTAATGLLFWAPTSVARQPNVIIYLVDTLRADHLGVYGYERDTSPVLDRWAEEGVIFDRAYATCSWTKPSVVSLLSGLDAVSHGVEDRLDVIPPGVQLLSEHLKSSGYATFAAVTNPQVLSEWGFGRGFDVYDDLDSAGHGTRADTVSDYVLERIGKLAEHQPFFLYLHVIDPHAPYDPPAPFDTRFPKSPALPAHTSIGHYDGEITFVDTQFGRVVEALKAHGLDNDTLTIFVADHGEELLDHGNFGHGATLFEEVVRVPLVIRFPAGAYAGTRVNTRVSLTDVVPTVMSLVGQSLPPHADGHDLTQLLNGNQPSWAKRELFLSLRTTGPDSHIVRGVIGGSHKYVRRFRPAASESLYNLKQDPAETDNLVGRQTDIHKRLSGTLDAYLERKSSGIHLRILNDAAVGSVECEVLLRTTGRFTTVTGVRLEADDRFELSADGQRLRFACQLENRNQLTRAGPRLVPDEDGLMFLVSPPDAPISVERLQLADGRDLPLRAGTKRSLEAAPFTFEAMDAKWSVRDVGELLGDAGSAQDSAAVGAYLGVIQAPAKHEEIPEELVERLRSLGYMGGTPESKRE